MRELIYNRVLEYPSSEVDFNTLDSNIQVIFKEQDFIQIVLRYLLSLFKDVESLYGFLEVYSMHERQLEENKEDDGGFPNKADMIVVNTAKNNSPIMLQHDVLRVDIDLKKREILLMCYSILEAICAENEINQNFMVHYLPIMQMHSFFFPEVISTIGRLFSSNQEILLKIKKKTDYPSKMLVQLSLNKANGFDLIDLAQIDRQARELVQGFFLQEGITSGGSNIFYFYCYYLLKTNSLEVRQKILDLFTKLSVFESESISANQDEVYFQMKENFKDLVRTQFFTITSRDKEMVVINPVTLKAMRLATIFRAGDQEPIELGRLQELKEDEDKNDERALLNRPGDAEADDEDDQLNLSDVYEDSNHLNTIQMEREKKLEGLPFETIPKFTEDTRNNITSRSELGDPPSDDRQLMDYDTDHLKSNAQIENQSESRKFSEEQKLFMMIQLNFYAGMMFDRNYTWRDMIEQSGVFSLEALLHYMLLRFESFEPNASLLRILQHMHIDQQPMHRMLVPQFCKVVGELTADDVQQTSGLKDSQARDKRPVGYNFDVQVLDPKIKKVQHRIRCYFIELKQAIKRLPLTFEELRDPENFELYKQQQATLVNNFTLEVVKTVQQLFEFGQYFFKVMPSQQKYMSHLLLKADSESNIVPLIRIMVRLLELEPEYPEARALFSMLKKGMIKMRSSEKEVAKMNNDLLTFKYAEAYEKIVMVEDVEKKEDEVYFMFEKYFRQYLIKDIAFKNYFKYKNPILEQIKVVILNILEVTLAYIADSYVNRAAEIFESAVISQNLVSRITKREFVTDSTLIQKIFLEKIEQNLDSMMPPIALTGLSLDFLGPRVNERADVPTNAFNLNTVVGQSLFPSLLLLFSFNQESEVLSSKSIELLIKVFSQRVQIIRNLNDVTVIQGKDDTKQLQKIKKDLQRLQDICDSAESWIRSPDDDVRARNLAEVVQRVDWLCRLISDIPAENMGAEDIVDLNEFTVDSIMQEKLRNLKAHLIITDFIRDTFSILAEDYRAATDPQTVFYFQALFLFLRKFCHKNLKNQDVLAKEITVFLQECPVEVGQASLIIEIYKDNETMCKTMQSLVTDDFIKWILKSGRRECFMDFFLNLMKCNETYLIDNQRKVLELFLDSPRKKELLFIVQDLNIATGHYETRMQFEPRIDPDNRFYSDEPYRYHAKVLRMLTYACAGKSNVVVNEVKVRNLFKLSYLLEIMNMKDAFTDSDEYQRAFVISPEDGEGEDVGVDATASAIQDLLKDPFIHERKDDSAVPNEKSALSPHRGKLDLEAKEADLPMPQQVKLPKRKERVRTTMVAKLQLKSMSTRRVISVLKIAVLEMLYFVYFESSSLPEEVIAHAGEFIRLFRKETQRLRHLEKEDITPDYVEYLFGNLLRMAISIETSLMKERKVLEDEELASFKMTEFVNEVGNKLELFEDEHIAIYIPQLITLSRQFNFDFGPRINKLKSSLDEHGVESLLPNADKSDIWRYLWTKFKQTINQSNKVKDYVHSEKQVLSKALNQIEDLFKIPIILDSNIESKAKKILINVNKKRIIRSIIGFVVDNYKQPQRKNTISEVLYCLGGMIPLNNEGMVDDKNEAAVVREQFFLEECGATVMVMKQLSDPLIKLSSDDYNLNLFRFATRLLKGGNKYIQAEILEFIRSESSSEMLFLKVYQLFQREIEQINKGQVSPDIPIVLSSLQLIQHFAEGHYQDLQLYIRLQTNSLRSYNLLEEVVSLLSSYLSSNKAVYFELIMQCFDTITELIQGPCFENQKFLMQGRIMETVSRLLSVDEFLLIEAQRRQLGPKLSKDSLRPWMIAKIKHKCSITLISLVECRTDNAVLSKMYTNLKKFLFDNIISFYINFKEIYGTDYEEDALEHIEATPADGHDELYCSVIIQTAFNYYTIIQKNLEDDDDESDSGDDDQEENIEQKMDEEKRELEETDAVTIPEPTTLDDLKRYLDYHRVKSKAAALDFMRSKTRSIEVVREDDKLERVYFLTVPYFDAITDNIKDDFNLEVTRVSCKTKCNDLLEASAKLLSQIRKERDILKNRVIMANPVSKVGAEELQLYQGKLLRVRLGSQLAFDSLLHSVGSRWR